MTAHISRIRASAATLVRRKLVIWTVAALAVYALCGFLLAPWLLRNALIDTTREQFGAELRVDAIRINPFVLSLRIEGLELDDPSGQPTFRVAELFANLQSSSIFRWALTLDEISASSPELYLSRNKDGAMNLAAFVQDPPPTTEAAEEPEPGKLPRILIFHFAILDWTVNWRDEVPAETVRTSFGPVNIVIDDLNTLPQRSGQQAVTITTETEGTLSWSGSLQLNPLRSVAHASIKGSHFPLTSAYIKHESGFNITDGDADAELDYTIDTREDGSLVATVDNFNLTFNDVRVETFSGAPAADQSNPELEVLRLPQVRLVNGALRWPEMTLALDSLSIDDALVSLYRNEQGVLNIQRDEDTPADAATETAAAPAGPAWQLSLGELAVNRLAFDLDDHSVEPFADVGLSELNLSIRDVSNQPDAVFPTRLDLTVRSGGRVSLQGDMSVLPAPRLAFATEVSGLALAGAHPYIQPLADVNLDSGAINLSGQLAHSAEEPLQFDGSFEIADFAISETDEGSRLGSWRSLRAAPLALSIAGNELTISEITFEEPYGDILIAADGSLNLGRIDKGSSDDVPDDAAPDNPESGIADEDEPMSVQIGRVRLQNATADFADESLPLPFSAKIAELNGELTTISTSSKAPSTVALEGKVDEFGFVQIAGSITPLEPSENTDILVSFRNVDMPKFTAYTIPFAGREIASGNLDLDLGYKVIDSQLDGDNKIVLRDLELGAEVEHPGAMSLPLGLAVALLKDPEGKIDIDLPVSGDIGDPEFSYGGVIMSALGNLLLKIVTSPFALLGNLVGAESDELEYVSFLDGRADLTPPEQQKVGKLAEALSMRPQLSLEIYGVIDRAADGLAMRTAKIDAEVEALIAGQSESAGNDGMYADLRRRALEDMYETGGLPASSAESLDILREQFTTVAEDQEPVFDELAYTEAVRNALIANQSVAEEEFVALARQRADSVHAALVAANPALDAQIIRGQLQGVSKKEDRPIEMRVTLTADGRTDTQPTGE